MDRTPHVDRLAELLAWIEQNLDRPLTVDIIADKIGLSPYHFSRLFSVRMGRGVMAHIRGRRLVKAAKRLLDEPQIRLVQLAFDSGFESQEAFTRAFRRLFGDTPGRFREGHAILPIEGQYPMTMPDDVAIGVAQLPELITKDAFSVDGISGRFDSATKATIPQLWSKLFSAIHACGQTESQESFGVIWDVDRADGSFSYMAGVKADLNASIPDGFTRKDIPRATYVVFRITLNGGPVHGQVKAALARVWGELVPTSGLRVIEGFEFERYDAEFVPTKPGAQIDLYLPVEV